MIRHWRLFTLSGAALLICACATPLSEQLSGKRFPVGAPATGNDVAHISFSADKKYETSKGVPLKGDPLICRNATVFRVNDDDSGPNQTTAVAGEEIAVTSVISWINTGFRKLCGPFVSFTPEKGERYIITNERIGGKGISMLWTGMAFQTCEVSVYKETPGGFERVQTHSVNTTSCRSHAE